MCRKRLFRAVIVLTLAAGSSACFGLEKIFSSPSGPSDTTAKSLIGNWNGQAISSFPTAQSCGALQWKITSQQGNQVNGEFIASCAAGIQLKGTISGTIGEAIQWAAAGNATQGTLTCPFTLNGTGVFQGTSAVTVNYAGTTCLGPLAGSETIRR